MVLSITKKSGSVASEELDAAVPVEDGNDILKLCPGGCKKKVLFFGFSGSADWGEQLDNAMCIDCKTRLLKKA